METKGKTLEEIDALFDGEMHSTVTDVEKIRKGEKEIDIKHMENELTVVVEGAKIE